MSSSNYAASWNIRLSSTARCVRLSSWRDIITISGELSEQYTREVVEQYLNDVAGLMLLLLGDE